MKRKNSTSFLNKIIGAIGSHIFLGVTLTFFVISSLWLAFSFGLDIGAYDEKYHYTIISAFKEHILPFMQSQNPAFDGAGDITRLSSYLFHYLLSWPDRLISLFTNDAFVHVFVLRVINITFFALGLFVFWRVLRRLGVGRAASNISILLVSLIPMSPQLAATINYDNLLFLIVGLTVHVFIGLIQARKPQYISVLLFIMLGLIGALVKYTFLPLYAPLFVFAVWSLWKQSGRYVFRDLLNSGKSIFKQKRVLFFIVSCAAVVSLGLFIERYGVNLAKYHAVTPKCEVMMSTERCQKYYVWERNDQLFKTRNERVIDSDTFVYAGLWARGMSVTPFFPYSIIDDKGNSLGPLPVPVKTFQVLAVLCLIVLIAGIGAICRNKVRMYLLATSFLYAIILFIDNYSSYLTYHLPVATNGRYLIVVMPLFIGFSFVALKPYVDRYRGFFTACIIMVVLLLLQGGGAMTNVLRGQPSWFHDRGVYSINESIKHVIAPFVKES